MEMSSNQQSNINHNFQGYIYSSLAGVSAALIGILIKIISNFKLIDIVFYRLLVATIFALPLLLLSGDVKLDRVFYKFAPLRTLAMTSNIFLRYTAYRILPLGEAQVIVFSNVIFTAILGRIFLKEKISRLIATSIFLSSAGLFLIAKVPELLSTSDLADLDTRHHSIGVAVALAASLMVSISVLFTRRLRHIDESFLVFSGSGMNAALVLALCPAFDVVSLPGACGWSAWGLILIGLVGYANGVVGTKALRTTNVSSFTLIRIGGDISLAIAAQIFIFGDPLTYYSSFGSLLVITGALMPPFKKWLMLKPMEHPLRQKLNFMLK